MSEPVRCAIYLRYSCELQDKRSLEDQRRECLEYINRRGWVVANEGIFIDEAVSGTLVSRAGYLALKKAAGAEQFDYVVVHDLSRLGRNARESIGIFEDFQEIGVHIVGVADGVDTGERDESLNLGMRAVFNQHFIGDMKKKVMRGLKGRALDGYSAGGRTYGYSFTRIEDPTGAKDGRGNVRKLGTKISIDPKQAEVARRIFELKGMGMGYRGISRQLSTEGIPSPRFAQKGTGDPTWSVGTIRGIVRQEKYKGIWTWNLFRYIKVPGTSKRVKRPHIDGEPVRLKREDLRIVSDELWAKAQPAPSNGNKVHPFQRQRDPVHPELDYRGKFLLSGLLKCSVCGSNLIAITSKGVSTFSCDRHRSRGDFACTNNLRVRRALAETVLLEEIQRHFLDPKVLTRMARELKTKLDAIPKPEPKELQAREAVAAELKGQIANLTNFVMMGDTSDAIRAALSEKEQKLKQVQREIEALTARQKASAPDVSEKWVADKLSGIRELFNSKQDKIPLIRHELRHLLEGQILMTPTGEGKGRHYVATVRGKPLEILGEIPGVTQVRGPTGNRTVSDTWWEFRIHLQGAPTARMAQFSAALVA